MDNANYENLKRFIITDFKIKKELIDMAPPIDSEALNQREIVKYTDRIYDSLRFIIREFKAMIKPYDREELFLKKINELSDKWVDKFISCKTDLNKLSAFYQHLVTDMSEELVNATKRECIGYLLFSFPFDSLKMTNSINEMLHVMHSYVINNEHVLQGVNVIDTKKQNMGYPITLYGKPSELANSIFNNFPLDLDVAWTDIVSFGDIGKTIMMVRDRGHALSIEIDYDKDDVMVRYFIPKLCNVEMINKLPGVNRVKANASIVSGTTGRFTTTKDKLNNDLFRFISMVPTDDDIIRREYEGNAFSR